LAIHVLKGEDLDSAKSIEIIKVVVALNYIGVHHHACERDGEEILSNKKQKRERWGHVSIRLGSLFQVRIGMIIIFGSVFRLPFSLLNQPCEL
jgi:hypothetical protein